jgi:hypothetical protein
MYLHKARPAIENLLAKLNRYRRLAIRYDKSMRNCGAIVAIARVLSWPSFWK